MGKVAQPFVAVLVFSWVLLHSNASNDTAASPQRCGSCWCIPGSNGTCPSYSPGISTSFQPSVYEAYASFKLVSTPLTLATSSGDPNCYPFADLIGSNGLSGYEESSYPQCAAPDATSSTVCAYKFTAFNVSCEGRSYDLKTYASSSAAAADGAYVVHSGACGVCSNAQDLSIRMSRTTIPSDAVLCGTNYVLGNGDFNKLQTCFENIGFTSKCALVWAHYTATSGIQCGATCFVGLNYSNSAPPSCDLAPCLNCSNAFAKETTLLGGFGVPGSNAGIVEAVARPCSAFARITYNPCVGASSFNKTEVEQVKTSAAFGLSIWYSVFSLVLLALVAFV